MSRLLVASVLSALGLSMLTALITDNDQEHVKQEARVEETQAKDVTMVFTETQSLYI